MSNELAITPSDDTYIWSWTEPSRKWRCPNLLKCTRAVSKIGNELGFPKLEQASCYSWEPLELPKMEVGGREINPHLKPDRCWTEDLVALRRGP